MVAPAKIVRDSFQPASGGRGVCERAQQIPARSVEMRTSQISTSVSVVMSGLSEANHEATEPV